MESFAALKRRTTDLLQSLPQSIPSIPAAKPKKSGHTIKGTWERISVPPLPRSSHSVDIIGGTVYIFGGEVSPRQPVDGDVHAVVLPFSGAPADYYAIKAKAAAKPIIPIIEEPTPEDEEDDEEDDEEEKKGDQLPAVTDSKDKELDDVPLGSPPVTSAVPIPIIQEPTAEVPEVKDKGKGKEIASPDLGDKPCPRVGHATAVIGNRIFLFGGRSGSDMKALDERGRVWVFDTKLHSWSFLDPAPPAIPDPITASAAAASPVTEIHYPAARSFHSAVATDKPGDFEGRHLKRAESWKQWAEGDSAEIGTPQRPIVGNVAARARDADSDGYGTFIIHAGCLADGTRANDVWAFDVHSRVWQQLPSAPGKPRGGTAICISKSRLYRFGGFNGDTEEGGQLDFLQLGIDSFDDRSTFGEVTLTARGAWQSLFADRSASQYTAAQAGIGADNGHDEDNAAASAAAATPLTETPDWPAPRSVAAMEAITTGGGREYLVLVFGERTPSGGGHETAGKFLDDAWAFQVPPQGMSTASVTDAMFGVMGWKSAEGKWARVELAAYDDEDDAAVAGPGPRGWVASAPMGELEENGLVVWGGLSDGNQRLGDGWILRLG